MISKSPTFSPTYRVDEGGTIPNPGYCIEGIEFATYPPSPAFGEAVMIIAESLPSGSPKGQDNQPTIVDLVHPEHGRWEYEWVLWRLAFRGGREFVNAYLSQLSNREDRGDFEKRKRTTPIPAFAKAAINDVKNQIIHRIGSVRRTGGPASFLSAAAGRDGGVDLRGSTMLWFIATEVLPELLVMGRVAVYVDAPQVTGDYIDPNQPASNHPYLYTYTRENIRNWAYNVQGQLTQVLLRDYVNVVEPITNLPLHTVARYRFLWLNQTTDPTTGNPIRQVGVAIFDDKGKLQSKGFLNLPEIPVRIFSVSESLMADIANHQVALMNMESADIISSLKSSFPIYTEQRDARYQSNHLQKANLPPEVRSSVSQTLESDIRGHDHDSDEIVAGPNHGRYYGAGLERPDFISPSIDPMKASMEKQAKLKEDIRNLLSLSLSNLKSSNVSGHAKVLEMEGTEAGLNAIGKELEHGEREIARSWGHYLGTTDYTEIIYPEQYTNKTDDDRLKEAEGYSQYADALPSATYRKSIQTQIAISLLQGRVSDETLQAISKEIQDSKYPTSNAVTIQADVDAGLVSASTGSIARGYPPEEAAKASEEHAQRLARIAKAQSSPNKPLTPIEAEQRGVTDLGV